jgi:hypothetical protein
MNIVYLNPWGDHGFHKRYEINGHTGLLTTIGGGDYLPFSWAENNPSLLLPYDWVMIPVWGGYYEFIFRLKKEYPQIKILGVTDIEMQAIQYAPRAELVKLIKIIRLLDIVLCSNPDFVEPLKKIRPDIYNLGGWCLFPKRHANWIKEPYLKDKNIISIGCSNCGYNRNIFENFLVFKDLLKYNSFFMGYYWNVLPEHREDIINIAKELGIDKNIMLLPEASDWNLFLRQFSDVYLSIHLYTFKVVSRLAQDAMGLGIPHIGCYSNYADRTFCPASVQEWDLNKAVENIIKLYEDPEYYESVRQKQFGGLNYYSEEIIGQRILDAIKSYNSK